MIANEHEALTDAAQNMVQEIENRLQPMFARRNGFTVREMEYLTITAVHSLAAVMVVRNAVTKLKQLKQQEIKS